MKSNTFDPFPKYLQIREVISRWLLTFAVGDRLPTETALAAQFEVSRETVRQALRALEQEGVIVRRPRIGTRVARLPTPPTDRRLTGPVEDFTALGLDMSTELLDRGFIPATEDVAAGLGLSVGTEIFCFRRLRRFDGVPLNVLEAYFPAAIGLRLARRNLQAGLVVPLLRRMLDPEIWEDRQEVEAKAPEPGLIEALEMPAGVPLLTVTRRFLDSRSRPMVLFRVRYRSDRYVYTVNLPQPRGSTRPP